MIFKVKLIESDHVTKVYSIKDNGDEIMFLVYLDKEWEWVDSCWFEPLS